MDSVYKDAARLLFEAGPTEFEGACTAIAEVLGIDFHPREPKIEAFTKLFKPTMNTSGYASWGHSWGRGETWPANVDTIFQCRVLALLFMSAIAEEE
jgi:hypothetical protein